MNAIVDYLGEQNPELPNRFIDELERVYDILCAHPDIGRKAWFIKTQDYLMYPMVKYSYALFYQVDAGRPVLTRVLHGKRDLESLFEEEY